MSIAELARKPRPVPSTSSIVVGRRNVRSIADELAVDRYQRSRLDSIEKTHAELLSLLKANQDRPIQVTVPKDAISVQVAIPDVHVTLDQMDPPTVNVNPTIDVHVPPTPEKLPQKKATVKHADGTTSTVEIE